MLVFSDCQDYNAKNHFKHLKIGYFTKTRKCKIETLKQEIKSVIIENYELGNRKNVKIKSSSLALSNYQKCNSDG